MTSNPLVPVPVVEEQPVAAPRPRPSNEEIAAWLIMLSGDGLVNAALGGLAPDPTWLINRGLVIPVIGAFCVIKWLGFYVVVYLAALQAVPREQYEAAALDGASGT